MLVLGAVLMLSNEGDNNSFSGVFMKVGFMLAAVWLAYPKLIRKDSQNAVTTVVVLLGVLVLFAARPRVAVGACVIGAVALAINWALKRFSQPK